MPSTLARSTTSLLPFLPLHTLHPLQLCTGERLQASARPVTPCRHQCPESDSGRVFFSGASHSYHPSVRS